MTPQLVNQRIHPHKLTLWVALGSIIMMFAGLSSAYLVKRTQPNWQGYELPVSFGWSTAVIILSSIFIFLAINKFKLRHLVQFRIFWILTILLGGVFIILQWKGFIALHGKGILLIGKGSNASASFLAVIAGMHIVHVLGGVIALLIMFIRSFQAKKLNYNSMPYILVGQYWHFVGVLWIYLYFFLRFIS